jgi:hypothetical protein
MEKECDKCGGRLFTWECWKEYAVCIDCVLARYNRAPKRKEFLWAEWARSRIGK